MPYATYYFTNSICNMLFYHLLTDHLRQKVLETFSSSFFSKLILIVSPLELLRKPEASQKSPLIYDVAF